MILLIISHLSPTMNKANCRISNTLAMMLQQNTSRPLHALSTCAATRKSFCILFDKGAVHKHNKMMRYTGMMTAEKNMKAAWIQRVPSVSGALDASGKAKSKEMTEYGRTDASGPSARPARPRNLNWKVSAKMPKRTNANDTPKADAGPYTKRLPATYAGGLSTLHKRRLPPASTSRPMYSSRSPYSPRFRARRWHAVMPWPTTSDITVAIRNVWNPSVGWM
mmetsp:Transcript_60776/g.185588  ORF Transcript_60776/g.185588 Transcript_60776/m.185588 type:complete len:222 (-) Transcript_60776:1622-2287(-)